MSMEYKLLDSGNGRKLEQAGKYRLIRPALNAFWTPSLPEQEWRKADGVFTRNSGSGGGKWDWKNNPPEQWEMKWGGLNLLVKPTSFGHLGFFAEQKDNWQWLRETCKAVNAAETLNLFAYSGGASLAMAQGGAKVTHIDSSKGMNDWGMQIRKMNPDIPETSVRWIAEDVFKFVKREIKRGRKYNGIVLDPPSFGRGTQGQVWKLEDDINNLLEICREITDTSKPYFILFSCHSQGFTPLSLRRILASIFTEKAEFFTGEMVVPESEAGKVLPAGFYVRMIKK